jgi:type I restriction enzyme S subunit
MRDGWQEIPLGGLFTMERSRAVPAELEPTTPYVGLEHIETGNSRPTLAATAADVSSSVTPFRPKNVLFGRLRPYLRKVAFAPCEGVCTPEILVLQPTVSKILPEYLLALAGSERVIQRCVEMSAGSRMPRTSASDLASIPVLLPPLAEQRRIVDLIAAVDESANAKRVIAQTARATLTALLEGAFATLWRERQGVPLGDCLSRVRRPVEVKADEMYSQIGVRSHGRGLFYKDPVPGSELGSKKVFWIEPGDLVFNIVFAWEGAVAVATSPEKGWCGSHRFPTYRSSGHADVNFFRHFFRTKRGVELLGLASPGSAGRNRTLNQQMLMNFVVPLPSVAETINLVNVLSAAEAVIEEVVGSLGAAVSLRIALLDDLLSGRHTIPSSYDELLST